MAGGAEKFLFLLYLSYNILTVSSNTINCDVLQSQKDFNMKQMVGRWYGIEIAYVDVDNSIKKDEALPCLTFDLEDFFPCDNQPIAIRANMTLEFFDMVSYFFAITTPDLDNPGNVQVSTIIPDLIVGGINLHVLHTDNDTMLAGLCYFDWIERQSSLLYISMISRSPNPIPNDTRTAYMDMISAYYPILPEFNIIEPCSVGEEF